MGDYCVVEVENLDMIENFKVTTMCEAVQEMRGRWGGNEGARPLTTTVGYCIGERGGQKKETPQRKTRCIVPENYLEDRL